MSRLIVCSIYDSAGQMYSRPFFEVHRGAAVRAFVDAVNRKDDNNALYLHPDDFTLYALAEFDDANGLFDSKGVEIIARGKDVKNP